MLLGWRVLASPISVGAAEVYPDFDLRVDCPKLAAGLAGSNLELDAWVVLKSDPRDSGATSGARAWSISIRPQGGASIVHVTTEGTDAAVLLAGPGNGDGYEKSEVTSGPNNDGAVSAVILSFTKDVSLPVDGEATLLRLQVEASVPESGKAEYGVDFVDGLMGSGQPVKNKITFGEGVTRRDDGGESDSDADTYEPCSLVVVSTAPFVRGNVNGDATVSLTDVVVVLDHLFQGQLALDCKGSADVNDDGGVNLSDAAYLLNFLFRGGPPPMAPYPACGRDSTPTNLDCVLSSCP